MTSYQPELLRVFLESGGLLILAKDSDKIAGAVIAHKLLHPAGEDSLYVHGLDTHPGYRRQGKEVWLGAETDNDAANAFYKTLDPYEIEPSVIYAYKVK